MSRTLFISFVYGASFLTWLFLRQFELVRETAIGTMFNIGFAVGTLTFLGLLVRKPKLRAND